MDNCKVVFDHVLHQHCKSVRTRFLKHSDPNKIEKKQKNSDTSDATVLA